MKYRKQVLLFRPELNLKEMISYEYFQLKGTIITHSITSNYYYLNYRYICNIVTNRPNHCIIIEHVAFL